MQGAIDMATEEQWRAGGEEVAQDARKWSADMNKPKKVRLLANIN